jgi:hypothetical protein
MKVSRAIALGALPVVAAGGMLFGVANPASACGEDWDDHDEWDDDDYDDGWWGDYEVEDESFHQQNINATAGSSVDYDYSPYVDDDDSYASASHSIINVVDD